MDFKQILLQNGSKKRECDSQILIGFHVNHPKNDFKQATQAINEFIQS